MVSEVKTWVSKRDKSSVWDGGNVSKPKREIISFLTLIFLIDVTSHVFHPGLPANLKITLHFNLQFSVRNNEGEEVKCSIQTAWASKFFPALLSHSWYRNRQIFELYLNYIAYSLSFAKGFKVFHMKNYLRRELWKIYYRPSSLDSVIFTLPLCHVWSSHSRDFLCL